MATDDGFCLYPEVRVWIDERSQRCGSKTYHYLEIAETGSGINVINETKQESEVPAICASLLQPGAKWAMKLLLISEENTLKSQWQSLPTTVVQMLRQYWRVPDWVYGGIGYNVAFVPLPKEDCFKGFALQGSAHSRYGALVITHDEQARCTTALSLGLSAQLRTRLMDDIIAARGYASHPCLIPLLHLQIALDEISRLIDQCFSDFLKATTGNEVYYPRLVMSGEKQDLGKTSLRLTAIADVTADITSRLTVVSSVLANLETAFAYPSRQAIDERVKKDILVKFALLHCHCDEGARWNQYLKESVQTQVQLVYALLAQRDNQMNLRYGADMRIISAVTLIFLPGTFIATLFSASFWNFQPSNTGPIVSKWIWLYFVVTALLTLAVWGFWRGYPMLRTMWTRKKKGDEETGKKEA